MKLIHAHIIQSMPLVIHLELKLLGLLPGEALVSEMSVLGGLVVNGVGKVEFLDNDTRAEIEVVEDDLDKLFRGLVRSTVGLNEERKGLGNTDGVGELDERTTGQLGVDERLGDPASKVGSGAVDLGVVLSGESTTTVSTPTTVGVDNDLTASKTGITLGTTDDEETGGLDLNDVSTCFTSVAGLKRTW